MGSRGRIAVVPVALAVLLLLRWPRTGSPGFAAAQSPLPGVPPLTQDMTVLFDIIYPPQIENLPVSDQHRLAAQKALTQPLVTDAQCGSVNAFYEASSRPDLWSAPNITWIVLDLRPDPLCAKPPPDRAWRTADRILALYTPAGSENCTYGNPYYVIRSINYGQSVGVIMSAAKAFGWSDVVLLSDQTCSWDAVSPDLKDQLRTAANNHNVTIHGSQGANSSCLAAGIENHYVLLLVEDQPEANAATLVHAYKQGWLDENRVILFNSPMTYTDGVMLAQLIEATYGEVGSRTARRFWDLQLHIGDYPGHPETVARMETFRRSWGQSSSNYAPLSPASTWEAQIWILATNIHVELLRLRCKPPLAGSIYPSPTGQYVVRLQEPGPRSKRAERAFNSSTWTFYNAAGAVTNTPQPLLESHDDRVPVAVLPVQLSILLLSDMPITKELREQTDAVLRREGLVGSLHPLIALNWTYVYQVNCSALIPELATTQKFAAILAVVDGDCRGTLQDNLSYRNYPMFFVGQGLDVEQTPARNVFTMHAPRGQDLPVLGKMVSHFNWQRPAMMVTDPLSAAELASFASVIISRTVVVPFLEGTQCQRHPKLYDGVEDLKAARTPLIILDIPADVLYCVMELLDEQAMLTAPYFYVLTFRAARGLPFLQPYLLNKLKGRLVVQTVARLTARNAEFRALLDSSAVQAPTFPYLPFVEFVEMAHTILTAAERRLYTFGFGVDSVRTRAAILAALQSITSAAPMNGLLQDFTYFDDKQAVYIPCQMTAFGPNGRSESFVALTTSNNVAVFRPEVLANMAVPTQADYDALLNSGQHQDKSKKEDDSKNLWWLSLLFGGLLLAIGVGVFFAVRHTKRRRRFAKFLAENQPMYVPTLPNRRRQELMELDQRRIHFERVLGIGSFGQIYLARLDSSAAMSPAVGGKAVVKLWQTAGDLQTVAVDEDRQAVLGELVREYTVLAQFHGEPRMLQVYGLVVNDQRPLGIALEYCSGGNLATLLARRRLSLACKLRMATEIAEGMKVVAAAGCMHLELATRHILITSDMHCKLGHIGIANMHLAYFSKRLRAPNVRWCAPEVLRELAFSSRSDVWSFGVLLYELATDGAMPFANKSSNDVKEAVLSGEHLTLPAYWPGPVHQCAAKCFQMAPSARPSFAELETQMREATAAAVLAAKADAAERGVDADKEETDYLSDPDGSEGHGSSGSHERRYASGAQRGRLFRRLNAARAESSVFSSRGGASPRATTPVQPSTVVEMGPRRQRPWNSDWKHMLEGVVIDDDDPASDTAQERNMDVLAGGFMPYNEVIAVPAVHTRVHEGDGRVGGGAFNEQVQHEYYDDHGDGGPQRHAKAFPPDNVVKENNAGSSYTSDEDLVQTAAVWPDAGRTTNQMAHQPVSAHDSPRSASVERDLSQKPLLSGGRPRSMSVQQAAEYGLIPSSVV